MNAAPTYDALMDDLRLVREQGLGNLRRYRVPALQAAAAICDLAVNPEQQEPAAIEALIRSAVASMGAGKDADAAEYTFGLVGGTKLWPKSERRKEAARCYAVSVDRFRKVYEPALVEQVAENILAACCEKQLRQTRVELEHRHPADSRLAVQWVERFEAYNRVWTPAWKLAADLEAAISARRRGPSDHPPWDPDSDEPYDYEEQAQGYARFALHAYAWFLLEVRRFMTKHGGLWLFSDAATESLVSDAVYKISWHNPLNEEDDSWLRRHLADARNEEQDHFAHLVKTAGLGGRIHGEWQAYVSSCSCPAVDEPIEGCQVHETISSCRLYCETIDTEWLRIADWYRPGSEPQRGVSGAELYRLSLPGPRSLLA